MEQANSLVVEPYRQSVGAKIALNRLGKASFLTIRKFDFAKINNIFIIDLVN